MFSFHTRSADSSGAVPEYSKMHFQISLLLVLLVSLVLSAQFFHTSLLSLLSFSNCQLYPSCLSWSSLKFSSLLTQITLYPGAPSSSLNSGGHAVGPISLILSLWREGVGAMRNELALIPGERNSTCGYVLRWMWWVWIMDVSDECMFDVWMKTHMLQCVKYSLFIKLQLGQYVANTK